MKKLGLYLLILLPLFSFGQNPFDQRTTKSNTSSPRSFEAEIVDGRNSSTPSYLIPSVWNSTTNNEPKTIQYRVKYETKFNLPIWLEVYAPEQSSGFGTDNSDNKFTPSSVLADLPGLFQWDKNSQLKMANSETDNMGYSHYSYNQYYNSVRVKGGQWKLHAANNQVLSGNGRIYPSTTINTSPKINAESAISIAKQFGEEAHADHNHGSDVVPYEIKNTAELLIDFELGENLQPQLVYQVDLWPDYIHHYKVIVDANTGNILKTIDQLCTIDGPKTATATDRNGVSRTLNTYQVGSTYYLIDASKSMWGNSGVPDDPVGAVWTIDAQNTAAQSFAHVSSSNNTWSDRSSVSAHYNAGLAFDYFKNTHSRNSINGSGGTIISIINVADQGGGSLENAYWNGQAMFYGNGGSAFKPLAGALDVAGHELTHGVVSNTANLEYEGQSGAINESMADLFGAMIDRDDWKMGEDVVKTAVFPSGALRDLKDPHNGGNALGDRGYQPERMSEYYSGSQDNYGVHINSGIVNRAFYLVATNTSKEKAEKIYYRALANYLTTRSQFLDLRYAVEKAADDLYGTAEVNAVKSAFDQVEIYDPNGGSGGGSGGGGGENDLPTNPGAEFIVSVDVDAGNSNTFYKSTPTPDGYVALSTSDPKRRCSITDDGDEMYYISENDDHLYKILLNSPYTESLMSSDDWDNVAISKDGNLAACITTEIDSSIYVYNFTTAVWKVFKLYNPTYSDGVNAGNVLYADAIEFDNTGQYILYDAKNQINGSSGAIEYWDVGVIRVWDNESTDWGDGKIEKVFTQLPAGVSIGNATYSKNSPYIIAFDYINNNNSTFTIKGHNTITNTTEDIFSQSILGFPSYSNDDKKIIFNAKNTNDDFVIAVQGLAANKLADDGSNAAVLIPDAIFGVWYANGERNLLNDEKDILTFAFPSLTGQPKGTIIGLDIDVEVAGGTDITNLVPTFTYSDDATVSVSNAVQTSGVTANNYSNTVNYKVTAQDGTSKTYKVNVQVIASINEVANSISIYPNPAQDEIKISSSYELKSAEIHTITGQSIGVYKNPKTLDLNHLEAGIYLLTIHTEKGSVTKRFTKK